MQEKLILSGSPHIKSQLTTAKIMGDVVIALIPACIAAVYFFGISSLLIIALCVASAVGCEWAIQRFTKQKVTINDLSAVVTGVLLALNLPPNAPWYIPVFGSAFAIIIVKQCFGGLGNNFMNPALAARCFLLISFPVAMTTFFTPFFGVDAVASATPLAAFKAGAEVPGIADLFLGNVGGSIGETSALALIIGGVYLLIKKVIKITIPLSYMATVAVFALCTGGGLQSVGFHLFAGGLMLGAWFMATDYVSSPQNTVAQIIFGVGCGVITMVVRTWGGYPEGVSFSILFMNLLTPLLNRKFRRKVFGEVKEVKGESV